MLDSGLCNCLPSTGCNNVLGPAVRAIGIGGREAEPPEDGFGGSAIGVGGPNPPGEGRLGGASLLAGDPQQEGEVVGDLGAPGAEVPGRPGGNLKPLRSGATGRDEPTVKPAEREPGLMGGGVL
eukprot:2401124-Alexandrium_andersonii.AAC.1